MKLKRHATLNENVEKEPMTINDMSEAFIEFYDKIKKFSPSMQEETVEHLKEAFFHLNQAWEGEAEDHGVDFTPYGDVFPK